LRGVWCRLSLTLTLTLTLTLELLPFYGTSPTSNGDGPGQGFIPSPPHDRLFGSAGTFRRLSSRTMNHGSWIVSLWK